MQPSSHTIIENTGKRNLFRFKEFLQYKDLLYFMVLRDITVVYKQSVLGFAWAFINPIFSMVVFSVVFGKLANVPHDGIPYPIFSYAALIPWNYFATSVGASGTSLIGNASIFTKVYFPRLIIPLTPIFSKLADFAISFILLVVLMFYYRYHPTLNLLILPLLMVIMILTTIGLGTFFSALALQYRDIKFALSFLIPLLMYAAPVVFPASLINNKFGSTAYKIYGLYPITGVIEGFRSAIVINKPIPWSLIGMSSIGACALFIIGITTFRRLENRFADVA
jgi:lipopolysaccharide transport system permease protein